MCIASFATTFGSEAEAAVARAGDACGGAWRCGNGACVPRARLCDGVDHCGDYTDEWRCSEYTTTARRSLLYMDSSIMTLCYDSQRGNEKE